MMKRALWIALALSVVSIASASTARADEWNRKTQITFSRPVEISGHVLPAGTYRFQMADSSDRHIVQILSADGSKIMATVMTIPDYRLTRTDETVVSFREVPAGAPEAIRAWFYPGSSAGEEFIYRKNRAIELAKASNVVVPAFAADVDDDDALKTAPIVAITPDAQERPVADAIETNPGTLSASVGSVSSQPSSADAGGRQVARNELPKTASPLPLILSVGLGLLAAGLGLMAFGKRATAPIA